MVEGVAKEPRTHRNLRRYYDVSLPSILSTTRSVLFRRTATNATLSTNARPFFFYTLLPHTAGDRVQL